VKLPKELTTGSSLMPQKQNPDVLELVRAHGVLLKSDLSQVLDLVAKLPGGYHRDFQLTKAPLLRGRALIGKLLAMTTLVTDKMTLDHEAIARALTPELWATHAAHERVREGVAFRDAYRAVGSEHLQGGGTAGRMEPLPPAPLSTLRAAADAALHQWETCAASIAAAEARTWQA
jgi:argininosuccinate lyase